MNNNIDFSLLYKSATAKLISCLVLTILADILFFGEKIGGTLGVFTLLLGFFYTIHINPVRLTKRIHIILCLLVGQSLALLESPNLISVILISLGFAVIIFGYSTPAENHPLKFLKFCWNYLWNPWKYLYIDSKLFLRYQRNRRGFYGNATKLMDNFFLIGGLSAIFITLFAYANPIIANWFGGIDLWALFNSSTLWRILFWVTLASCLWSIINPRKIQKKLSSETHILVKPHSFLLTNHSVQIALILFNLIFLVENFIDAQYLFGNHTLPEGATYAQYARNGAYALMVTTLISIGFILVILKPGRGSEQSSLIRNLIYVWVTQNIFLVISSASRLYLYIDHYHLTLSRVAALIWLCLVAAGFILIITRITLNKTNGWLITTNFACLLATLYICSFVDFRGIIAEYNVAHSKEMGGSDIALDPRALDVGAIEILPALIKLHKQVDLNTTVIYGDYEPMISARNITKLRTELTERLDHWRTWSFRYYRIQKQIADME